MHRSTWQFDGRFRSVVTMPEYRVGMKPANFGHKYPAEVLTLDEVQRLIGAMPRRGYAGPRNRALTGVLVYSGLRIAEALALRPKDVDLEAGTITVLHGKGDKRRTVGLPPAGVALIEVWLAKRAELAIPRTIHGVVPPLFCVISAPRQGRPMYASYYREALAETALRAGIDKRVTPHSLRHTNASHMARANIPLRNIQRHLGPARSHRARHRPATRRGRGNPHLRPNDRRAVWRQADAHGRRGRAAPHAAPEDHQVRRPTRQAAERPARDGSRRFRYPLTRSRARADRQHARPPSVAGGFARPSQ